MTVIFPWKWFRVFGKLHPISLLYFICKSLRTSPKFHLHNSYFFKYISFHILKVTIRDTKRFLSWSSPQEKKTILKYFGMNGWIFRKELFYEVFWWNKSYIEIFWSSPWYNFWRNLTKYARKNFWGIYQKNVKCFFSELSLKYFFNKFLGVFL